MALSGIENTGRTDDQGRTIWRDDQTGELFVFGGDPVVTSTWDAGPGGSGAPAMPMWGWIALGLGAATAAGIFTWRLTR